MSRHVERVLAEIGQSLRPMSEAPRDGRNILVKAASGFVVCHWDSDPENLAGVQREADVLETSALREILDVQRCLRQRGALKMLAIEELLPRPANHALMELAFGDIRDRHRGDHRAILENIEAIAELQSDGQSFHVFLDEDTGMIEIVFRRTDGSGGIIEPVVP